MEKTRIWQVDYNNYVKDNVVAKTVIEAIEKSLEINKEDSKECNKSTITEVSLLAEED